MTRCRIDEEHHFEFKLGTEGYYEVYENKADADGDGKPINTPVLSLKKYYQDQEFILNVCSEG